MILFLVKSNKTDTIAAHFMDYTALSDQILNILTREYLNELNLPKSKKGKKLELKPAQLAYSDITVWFYKRQCEQSLEEAKIVWEQLPENPLQRQDLSDFLRLYTEEIINKYNRHTYYSSKLQFIASLINQVKTALCVLSHYNSGSQDVFIEDPLRQDKMSINLTLDSIQGHDLDSVFHSNQLIGHHIEISDNYNVIYGPVQSTNGYQIEFNNHNLTYNIPLCSTMVSVSLYEDFLVDGIQSKKLVARGEFDLFSLVIKAALNAEQGLGSQEPFFETFKLNKIMSQSLLVKNGARGSFCNEVSLTMRVSAESVEAKNQLGGFYDILQRRLFYLEQKFKNTKVKQSGYNKRLKLMLLPFSESIDYDGESIAVNDKNTSAKKPNQERCNIF